MRITIRYSLCIASVALLFVACSFLLIILPSSEAWGQTIDSVSLSEKQTLQIGVQQEQDKENRIVEASYVNTIDEDGVSYDTYVQYDGVDGKICWGEVDLMKTEPDDNGVVYWFFTNPDKKNHSDEVQLAFIDKHCDQQGASTQVSEFELVIPNAVTVRESDASQLFRVTAIGAEFGSKANEGASLNNLLRLMI